MALNRFGFTLADVEREHILETLACCHGNRTRAAKLLDISIRCLRMKLREFDQSRGMVAEAEMGLSGRALPVRRILRDLATDRSATSMAGQEAP